MQKKKIAMVVLVAMMAVIVSATTGCNENANSSNEEIKDTPNTGLEGTMYEQLKFNEDITPELINSLSSLKNKDYEMKITETPYSKDELAAEALSSNVFFVVTYNNLEKKTSGNIKFLNGYIYDIDNSYIYMISAKHGFETISFGEEIQENTRVTAQFITGEIIDIPLENIKMESNPLFLYIDINSISNETLNNLKTINIDNMYNTKVEDLNELYCFAYNGKNASYETFSASNFSLAENYIKMTANTIHGCSGAAYFDCYGNFKAHVNSKNILTNEMFNMSTINTLKEINPNYGEPIESSTE